MPHTYLLLYPVISTNKVPGNKRRSSNRRIVVPIIVQYSVALFLAKQGGLSARIFITGVHLSMRKFNNLYFKELSVLSFVK